jgi:hypothetical protein
VKLHLLQELLDLNQAFENVIGRLERMEHVTLFDKEQVRYTRAEVERARVEANREFFDQFKEIVEKDAQWAYKFCQAYDQKTKDSFDFYLEIKEREEARRKKGLPPRAVLLPDWDKDDEERYEEQRTERQNPIVNKRKKSAGKRKSRSARKRSHAHPRRVARRQREGTDR